MPGERHAPLCAHPAQRRVHLSDFHHVLGLVCLGCCSLASKRGHWCSAARQARAASASWARGHLCAAGPSPRPASGFRLAAALAAHSFGAVSAALPSFAGRFPCFACPPMPGESGGQLYDRTGVRSSLTCRRCLKQGGLVFRYVCSSSCTFLCHAFGG